MPHRIPEAWLSVCFAVRENVVICVARTRRDEREGGLGLVMYQIVKGDGVDQRLRHLPS